MVSCYYLLDPRTQAVRYVGITSRRPSRRLAGHKYEARHTSKMSHRIYWIRSLLLLNISPVLTVQTTFADMDEAHTWERTTIARLRQEGYDLTNNTDGGEGTIGLIRNFTSEHRRKLGDIHRGKPVTLGGARIIDNAGRCSRYIKSCEVGLDSKDSPVRLEIISDLTAAKKTTPAVLRDGKTLGG